MSLWVKKAWQDFGVGKRRKIWELCRFMYAAQSSSTFDTKVEEDLLWHAETAAWKGAWALSALGKCLCTQGPVTCCQERNLFLWVAIPCVCRYTPLLTKNATKLHIVQWKNKKINRSQSFFQTLFIVSVCY